MRMRGNWESRDRLCAAVLVALVSLQSSGPLCLVGRCVWIGYVEFVLRLDCDIADKSVMDKHSPKQYTTGCLFHGLLPVFLPQDLLYCDFQKATILTCMNSRRKSV
jgi:hypothetical protein